MDQALGRARNAGFSLINVALLTSLVGDVLRDEIGRPGSTYGPIMEDNMRNGRIGPKEITVSLLKEAMLRSKKESAANSGFVIDGRGSHQQLTCFG